MIDRLFPKRKPPTAYTVETRHREDAGPVFKLYRTQGNRSREVANYSDQNAALTVRDALNAAASFEI